MVRLGIHVSVAGGLFKAVDRAREKGCDAFQIFTANPTELEIKTHLNDSLGSVGSHLDRHEHIGLGQIGESGSRAIFCKKPRLRDKIVSR
jgi:deoxyribonuclease IV